jgi:lipopolysaccharide export system protein LptA
MSKIRPSVNTASDSFDSWVVKTNNIISDLANVIVTSANGGEAGTTTGNVAIVGILSSNTGAFESLRGGTTALSATLPITSNVSFTSETVSASANVVLTGNLSQSVGKTFTANGSVNVVGTMTISTSTPFTVSAANTVITSSDGKITFNGATITANGNLTVPNGFTITANGTNITTMNATQLTTGTIPDARIASTIARSNITITPVASSGITGGGDLTANRTIGIDGSVIPFLANNQTFSGTNTFANLRNSGHILPSANNTLNIGSATMLYANMYATLFNGTATSARYADLAEKYEADAEYEVGIVMAIGGEKEVTAATDETAHSILGVVSAYPAYLMNSGLEGGTTVALKGRVPVKVAGDVLKGDRLCISAQAGIAESNNSVFARSFAIALESGTGVVEAVIL